MPFYTGIGSRQTPINALQLMTQIAIEYSSNNYTLRSGGADGADKAFELGCDQNNGSKEIYIPWNSFNNCYINQGYLVVNNDEAFKIAEDAHPAWDRCSPGAKKLHTRNVYQVLGVNLNSPSEVIICWTADGKGKGGTGQAIRIAKNNNIPIIDLYDIIKNLK